jgi:2-alkyl-3-oxoalkanoate reductase
MRIFIAGATGVIGRRVVPLLVQLGHEVTAVGRSTEKRTRLELAGAHAVDVDLFDATAVRRALTGHDIVINLATAVPATWRAFLPRAWRGMDRVRRHVSANLADAAMAEGTVGRMIQESFAPIYPDSASEWIDERSPVRPARYNRSTLDAESNAMRIGAEGRAAVVLRFGAFYGPNDPFTTQLVEMVRRGVFPLFGHPDGYFSFVEHGDAARAVVAALAVPPGIYNVVEREPMRRRELATGLAETVHRGPLHFLPPWSARLAGSMGETLARSLRISSRKLERAGDWTPWYATTLEGLRAVIEGTSDGP